MLTSLRMYVLGIRTRPGPVAGGNVMVFIAITSFLCASAWGQSITLGWSPCADPQVTGYNLYYGGSTQTYTNVVAVGNVTNATISGLCPGAQYFFGATAVDVTGLESAFSNEISYQVPGGHPSPALPPIGWSTPAAIVYGTALSAAQLNASSSVPGVFTYNPPANTVLNAGSQVLSVTFSPTDTNTYALVATNIALVVSPGTLTITPVTTSKLYGAALPTLAASYSGFVNGDTVAKLTTPPVLTTTATATSPVGAYPITASGATSPNYSIGYAGGTLTVSAAPLTITAANASKLYGAALPTLAASYSGFVNGDTVAKLTTQPILTATATAASPVGAYPIRASGAASPNYAIGYAGGTLTVSAAPLTITAVNTNKPYGGTLPKLTASYSGFVNGDKVANLTTQATLTTTATATSPVGKYPITANGAVAPNYAISYVAGTLTVTKNGVKLLVENSPSWNLNITARGKGLVEIGGQGQPGSTCTIQCATNLTPAASWSTLGVATVDDSGAFTFIDACGEGLRYYRAVYP